MPCGVGVNTPDEVKQNLTRTCLEVCSSLRRYDDDENNCIGQSSSTVVRADTDLRENYSPGWKFNHWELKVFILNI